MAFSEKNFVRFVIGLSIIMFGLTLLGYHLNKVIHFDYFFNSEKYIFHYDRLGQFGDFIGGVLGTFLTIIATVYVYKTYTSQREELEGQRKLIIQQQFESTFFNLLNTHRELKKDLKLGESGNSLNTVITGVEVIEKVVKSLKDKYSQLNGGLNPSPFFGKLAIEREIDNLNKIDKANEEDRLKYIYDLIFYKYQNQISHYCRNVYHILKFLRRNEEEQLNSSLKTDHKLIGQKFKEYANIFQSQLNVDEQILIFYDYIYFNGETKGVYSTMNLVNHYKFLENVGEENLIKKEHSKLYNFPITHKQ